MKDIAIVGAGGFGRETALMIRQINASKATWNLLGFYDDHLKGQVDALPVLGNVDQLNAIKSPISVAIAIANPQIKKRLRTHLTNSNITYPALMHPQCQLGDESNTIGEGCIITSGCILTINVHLGDFVIVNLLTTIGHDVTIGSYTSIMPNCSLSGFDSIGEECMIGAGARILQNLSIGNQVVVGAGAVVTKAMPPGVTVIGIPAQKV